MRKSGDVRGVDHVQIEDEVRNHGVLALLFLFNGAVKFGSIEPRSIANHCEI